MTSASNADGANCEVKQKPVEYYPRQPRFPKKFRKSWELGMIFWHGLSRSELQLSTVQSFWKHTHTHTCMYINIFPCTEATPDSKFLVQKRICGITWLVFCRCLLKAGFRNFPCADGDFLSGIAVRVWRLEECRWSHPTMLLGTAGCRHMPPRAAVSSYSFAPITVYSHVKLFGSLGSPYGNRATYFLSYFSLLFLECLK